MNCVTTIFSYSIVIDTESHDIHMDPHLNKICTKLEKMILTVVCRL